MNGLAGDLMVGVKHGFLQQISDMPTPELIQHPPAVASAFDQAGQPEL